MLESETYGYTLDAQLQGCQAVYCKCSQCRSTSVSFTEATVHGCCSNSCRGCRFNDVFARDEQHMPRNWSPSANIPAIAQQARQSAARLLALLAVIRLHSVKVCVLSFDCTLSRYACCS